MGLLANFKIRTKVIIALLPLAIMVIVAVLYSSDRMSAIDAGYSTLIDKDVNALQDLTVAQSLNNLFGQILYKEIAETNSDRMRVIDADLDQNGDAEEAFRDLQDAVAGAVEKPQLDALGASITDFDFETALRKLDEIAESCKQTEDQAK